MSVEQPSATRILLK